MSAPSGSTALGAELISLAQASGIRIAVAESLTGGLLADALVSVPGASQAFSGGIVAYDTALKYSLLGVDLEILRTRGPVDERVATQMADGARRACGLPDEGDAELGISTTGVAGPDPDPQSGQAAGVVWVGVSLGAQSTAVRLDLRGDRAAIRRGAVTGALGAAIERLRADQSLRIL